MKSDKRFESSTTINNHNACLLKYYGYIFKIE